MDNQPETVSGQFGPPDAELPAGPAPEERDPVWGYSDLVIVLGLLIPASLLAFAAVFPLFWLLPFEAPQGVKLILVQFVMFALLMVAIACLLRVRYGREFLDAMAWDSRGIRYAQLFFGGFFLALGASLTAQLLGAPPTENLAIKELLKDPFSIVVVAISAVTLGPVFEELAFRGFVLPLLTRTFGAAGGIILTSLPFTLLHGKQYSWSWQHLGVLFAVSAVFCWVRLRTGSTLASTVMHVGHNFLPTIVLLSGQYK